MKFNTNDKKKRKKKSTGDLNEAEEFFMHFTKLY